MTAAIQRGKPADYGQEILKRRFRRTAGKVVLNGKLVLDFGCGNGAQTMEFAGAGCSIIAADIGIENLSVLAGRLREIGCTTVLPVHYDGVHLPVRPGSIDVVLSYEVIEHVEDEAAMLDELRRVLRPGGEMVISVPNKGWVFETHGADLPLLKWNRVPFLSWLPHSIHGKIAHARIYRKKDIVPLLRSGGFRVVSAEYITAPMDVVKVDAIKRVLRSTIFRGDTTRISMFSTSILVHCAKGAK